MNKSKKLLESIQTNLTESFGDWTREGVDPNDIKAINSIQNAQEIQAEADLYFDEIAENAEMSEEEVINKYAELYKVELINVSEPSIHGTRNVTIKGAPTNVIAFLSNGEFTKVVDFVKPYDLFCKILNECSLNEAANLVSFENEDAIKAEFTNPVVFTEDQIEYIGDSRIGNCKQNAMLAHTNSNEYNPEVYAGYIILQDEEGKLVGIKHYWNGKDGQAIEHTAVKDSALYKKGTLLYYIGELVKAN